MTIKAVIFDIGGVVVGSPLEEINKYEKELGLPNDFLNVAIAFRGNDGAFQRLERGETSLQEFYTQFGEELSDPINVNAYNEYLKRRNRAPLNTDNIPNIKINGRELFGRMIRASIIPFPVMIEAIKRIRNAGFKVAALTNTFVYPTTDPVEFKHITGLDDPVALKTLRENFDLYIESAVHGMRKPERNFFLHACKLLNVEPSECVFLDDIGPNLKVAASLGMKTIRVAIGQQNRSLKSLESLLDLDLGLHKASL